MGTTWKMAMMLSPSAQAVGRSGWVNTHMVASMTDTICVTGKVQT